RVACDPGLSGETPWREGDHAEGCERYPRPAVGDRLCRDRLDEAWPHRGRVGAGSRRLRRGSDACPGINGLYARGPIALRQSEQARCLPDVNILHPAGPARGALCVLSPGEGLPAGPRVAPVTHRGPIMAMTSWTPVRHEGDLAWTTTSGLR